MPSTMSMQTTGSASEDHRPGDVDQMPTTATGVRLAQRVTTPTSPQ